MAKKRSAAVSQIDIPAIEAEMRSFWSGRNAEIERARALRFLEEKPQVPPDIEQRPVVAPTPYSIVERVTGMLTANVPQITVPPASEKKSDMELASLLERWTSTMLDVLRKQARRNVLDLFIQSLIGDGHACMRLQYAPQLWAGYPEQRKDEDDKEYNERSESWKRGRPQPLSWTWCDPLTIFPRWDELGLFEILEVDERPVLQIQPYRDRYNRAHEYPEIWEFDRATAGTTRVKFQQLWRRDSLTYAVQGRVIHHQPLEGYSRPPYIYSFGQPIATTDPARMGLSILFPIRDIKLYLDELLTQKATGVRLANWPTWTLKVGARGAETDPATGGPRRTLRIRPGKILTIWDDEDIDPLEMPRNSPEIDQMIAITMQMQERAGLADVLYGQSGAGDSGYLVNQLIAAARIKLRPLVEAAETALEELICLLWDIMETQIRQTLYVYYSDRRSKGGWLHLDPEKINGYRQVQVHLMPLMPTDEYARASMHRMLVEAGLESRERAMEQIGIEQPDEEMRRIRYERWEQSPAVDALLTQEAIKRLGFKLQPRMLPPEQLAQQYPGMSSGLQEAILGQGEAPPGAVPAAPPGAVPGAPPAGTLPAEPDPFALAQQALRQGVPVSEVVAMLLQAGMPPEQILNFLVQMGINPQEAQMLIQQIMAMGNAGGGPIGNVPQVGGSPGIQVAPGRLAVPPPPRPQAGADFRRVRPSGIATGQAPGVQMEGAE